MLLYVHVLSFFTQLESFHLYETVIFRHMFDYEKRKGQSFIKDEKKRLKSYEWTETGIKFTIQDIKKEMDLGIYLASVEKGSNSEDKRIKLDNFFGQSFICLNYICIRT